MENKANVEPTTVPSTLVAATSEPTKEPTKEPTEAKKPTKKRQRKPRSYTVAIQTKGHQSVTTLEKSGPLAAASNVVRSHVKALPLKETHNIWVRSHSKFHPYKVNRNYDNPKHRRFVITKSGDSIPIKDAVGNEDIPSSLRP